MIQRCPHCELILAEEEWRTGVCACCLCPLREAGRPAAVPPLLKRGWGVLGPGGAFLLLALAALLAWRSSGPTPQGGPDGPATPTAPDPVIVPPPKIHESFGPPKPEEKILPAPTPLEDAPGGPKVVAKGRPPALGEGEASAFAQEVMAAAVILAEKHHRELDERRLIGWAVRGLFEAANEAPPPGIERMMREAVKERDLVELLLAARETLGRREDLAAPRDADAALRRIFSRLDPHTTLLDADAMTRLNLSQNGGRVGELGLLVRRRPRSEAVEVVTPLKDGPAYKAGIRAGDIITRVRLLDGPDGVALKTPEGVAPAALADDGGRASWGRVGSRVEVAVRRPGDDGPRVYTLARSKVKREKVLGLGRLPDDGWDHMLDPKKGICYVRLADFQGPETARDLSRLLDERPKLQGLVLDLRFAGGGLIQTAFDVADLFIPGGLIVEFRSRNLRDGKGRWESKGRGRHAGIPMACLINGETGACTEIVAAALQDHGRARVVGERTAGKARVQNYFPTVRGTLRITTSHAYRPSGKPLDRSMAPAFPFNLEGVTGYLLGRPGEWDEWGVTPDEGYAVPLSATAREDLRERFLAAARLYRRGGGREKEAAFRDPQLERALEALRRDME